MKKICLITDNELFFEDLSSQLNIFIPEIEITTSKEESNINLFLIDENESLLKKISSSSNSTPIIFFSGTAETSDYADVVIQKPFLLLNFIKSLKDNKLLPKVRRKECLNFKEYSLYPVKKEITSSQNDYTIKLTEKEVTILKYLYNNQNKISSISVIL